MDCVLRFLEYVSYDTQSAEESTLFPSTPNQLALLQLLHDQLLGLGLTDVTLDEWGYVMATIPASPGFEDVPPIGFIAHVDTSPDFTGAEVKPQFVQYAGGDIVLNAAEGIVMRISDFPELAEFVGRELITTDGTTLLGADDKAGVAEIMSATALLMQRAEPGHGPLRIGFTPDEEVGRGVDHFEVARFGARFAYTVDGGRLGELEQENFNAATAEVFVQGRNIHPGYAKDKMINALRVAREFDALLPDQRPEGTEGREGFFHLHAVTGDVEHCRMEYLVRDHDHTQFEARKTTLKATARQLNHRFGAGTLRVVLRDQYYNMREPLELAPEAVEVALCAMRSLGIEPVVRPIRGGTDGARLSFMGLPCPNLFTGGENFHGRYEFLCVETMRKSVETLVRIAEEYARRTHNQTTQTR